MMQDDPPYLTVGTEVSAKYKGAFCEAKIRKVVRVVKCRVTFKSGMGSFLLSDDLIKGTLRLGGVVEAKHPDKANFLEATISKIQDCSQYTVVFDDGDITTLRRSALCLKSGRHFNESETLDQLPLTHPEHFSNPVVGGSGRRGVRRRLANNEEDEEDDDEEESGKDSSQRKRKGGDEVDFGTVVCVEISDKKKGRDPWFPALVVSPGAQEPVKIRVKDECLVRSFKDGRYYTVPKKEITEFVKEQHGKLESSSTVLKAAVEKAVLFLDKDELPPHWDRDILFGAPGAGDLDMESESEISEEVMMEKVDTFVAQLYKFMEERGTPINKAPTICNKDLDLHKLYSEVVDTGGYTRVTNSSQWKNITGKLGFGTMPSTSTINLVKQAYKKYLSPFEDMNKKLGCNIHTSSASGSKPRNSRSVYRSGGIPPPAPKKEKEEAAAAPPPPPPAPTKEADLELVKEETDKKEVDTDSISLDSDSTKKSFSLETETEPRRSRSRQDSSKSKKEKEKDKDAEDDNESQKSDSPVNISLKGPKRGKGSKDKEKFKDLLASASQLPSAIGILPTTQTKKDDEVSSIKAEPPSPAPSSQGSKKGRGGARKKKENKTKVVPEEEVKEEIKEEEKSDEEIIPGAIGKEVKIATGDKLSVFYPKGDHNVTYDAKVVEVNEKTEKFFVHYLGWNIRYDEWISRGRIAENLSLRVNYQSKAQGKGPAQTPTEELLAEGGKKGKKRGRSVTPAPGAPPTPQSSTGTRSKVAAAAAGGKRKRISVEEKEKEPVKKKRSYKKSLSKEVITDSESENDIKPTVSTTTKEVVPTKEPPTTPSSIRQTKKEKKEEEKAAAKLKKEAQKDQVLDLSAIRTEMKGLDKTKPSSTGVSTNATVTTSSGKTSLSPPALVGEQKLDIYEFEEDSSEAAPKLKMFSPRSPEKREEASKAEVKTEEKAPEPVTVSASISSLSSARKNSHARTVTSKQLIMTGGTTKSPPRVVGPRPIAAIVSSSSIVPPVPKNRTPSIPVIAVPLAVGVPRGPQPIPPYAAPIQGPHHITQIVAPKPQQASVIRPLPPTAQTSASANNTSSGSSIGGMKISSPMYSPPVVSIPPYAAPVQIPGFGKQQHQQDIFSPHLSSTTGKSGKSVPPIPEEKVKKKASRKSPLKPRKETKAPKGSKRSRGFSPDIGLMTTAHNAPEISPPALPPMTKMSKVEEGFSPPIPVNSQHTPTVHHHTPILTAAARKALPPLPPLPPVSSTATLLASPSNAAISKIHETISTLMHKTPGPGDNEKCSTSSNYPVISIAHKEVKKGAINPPTLLPSTKKHGKNFLKESGPRKTTPFPDYIPSPDINFEPDLLKTELTGTLAPPPPPKKDEERPLTPSFLQSEEVLIPEEDEEEMLYREKKLKYRRGRGVIQEEESCSSLLCEEEIPGSPSQEPDIKFDLSELGGKERKGKGGRGKDGPPSGRPTLLPKGAGNKGRLERSSSLVVMADTTPPSTPDSTSFSTEYGSPHIDGGRVSPQGGSSNRSKESSDADSGDNGKSYYSESNTSSRKSSKANQNEPPSSSPKTSRISRGGFHFSGSAKKRRMIRKKSPTDDYARQFGYRGIRSSSGRKIQSSIDVHEAMKGPPPPPINLAKPPLSEKFNHLYPQLEGVADPDERIHLVYKSLQDIRETYLEVKNRIQTRERKERRRKRKAREKAAAERQARAEAAKAGTSSTSVATHPTQQSS